MSIDEKKKICFSKYNLCSPSSWLKKKKSYSFDSCENIFRGIQPNLTPSSPQTWYWSEMEVFLYIVCSLELYYQSDGYNVNISQIWHPFWF